MLLSRVANDIYWMGRYLERAENIARFIEVNWHLSLDLHDSEEGQWNSLVQVTGDSRLFMEQYGSPTRHNVIQFLVFDTRYQNSIITSINRARENARAVRDQISPDMWEQINRFHLLVKNAAAQSGFIESNPQDFLQQVRRNGALFGGLANDTMTHSEGWHFFQMGRFLERAEKTSRILDVKYFILLPEVDYVGSAYDMIQWGALLRSASGLETFRQHYGRITPEQVVQFLLLDRAFPRSVLHCLNSAESSLRAISGTTPGRFTNPAEQSLGSLLSELAYSDSRVIIKSGLHEFIDKLQEKLNRVDLDIFQNFFAIHPVHALETIH